MRSLFRVKKPAFLKTAVLLLLVLACAAGSGLFLRGRVISVTDGDSVTVFTGRGTRTVRLYGIDCPEGRQAGGPEAAKATERLVLWREVNLETMDTDQYGRAVAILTLAAPPAGSPLAGGRSLNEELVAAGHAWVYRRFCRTARCEEWQRLEKEARENKQGLWQAKKPVPPWQWRRQRRK